MLKPRLIFTLLYSEGTFNLSRNFNLQSVGDLDWLTDNYEFESIAQSIDELVILNVNRNSEALDNFCLNIQKLSKYCFMPISVGGNINDIKQVEALFNNGADKIVLNTAYFTNESLVLDVIKRYGRQSIVASVDFKRNEQNNLETYIKNGSELTGLNLKETIKHINLIGAGEVYLTSITNDGTGFGYDLDALKIAFNECDLPIIASGGADTYDKLVQGIQSGFTNAVSTSHLYNFICDGLKDARESMMIEGVNLSKWKF